MSAAAPSTAQDIDWEVALSGFEEGLNLRDPANKLSQSELRMADNVLVGEFGSVAARPGCKSQGIVTGTTSSHRILSIYFWERSTPTIIVHTSDGRLMYTTNEGAAWTQIATGKSTTAPYSFETFNNKVYMSNGTDNYASWDGTTYTEYASAPKGKFLRLWKDTMWVSGITATPDRVYSSNPGDAETFGVSAWVDIAKGDGDTVMSLATDGNYLIVAKRNRIWVIQDPVTFSNRLVDYERGCESHFSWANAEGLLCYLSRRGIYAFFPDQPGALVSGKLDPVFSSDVINVGALAAAWSYSYQGRVGWALPEIGSQTPTFQIEWNPRLEKKPWTIHRMPVRCFARWRTGSTLKLFGGSTTSNKMLSVFDSTVGDDDGATYVAQAATGWMDLGSSDLTKYLRRMRIVGRGGPTISVLKNFSFSAGTAYLSTLGATSTDLWTTSDSWNVGLWGPTAQLDEQHINTDVYFRQVSLLFRDQVSGVGRAAPIDVGAVNYAIAAGRWAIHHIVMAGMIMGPGR